MMRKHPDAIALIAIGFALFASIGLESSLRRLDQGRFLIHPLVFQSERLDAAVQEAVGTAVREVVRELLSCR